MSGFTKLKSSILQSTIWDEAHHVRILWITMLALSDSRGNVEGSIPGLARMARVTIDECLDGLKILSNPDSWSRTKDNEGRRIKEVDGGWFIYNYEKIRGRTSTDRMREKRERDNGVTSHDVSSVTTVTKRQTAADPEADPEKNKLSLSQQHMFDLEVDKTSNTKTKLEETAKKYLEIFNAVFDRKCRNITATVPKIEARLKTGIWKEWQILCMPILQAAADPKVRELNNFSPETLLRDGSHKRTGANGITYGAVDWMDRIYGMADTLHLNRRLSDIARHYSLIEKVKLTGAGVS